jgi:hypothetical protein
MICNYLSQSQCSVSHNSWYNPSFICALLLAHSLFCSIVPSWGDLWYMLPFLIAFLSSGFTLHHSSRKCCPSQATDADKPFLLGNSFNLMSPYSYSLSLRIKSWQPELYLTLLFQHISWWKRQLTCFDPSGLGSKWLGRWVTSSFWWLDSQLQDAHCGKAQAAAGKCAWWVAFDGLFSPSVFEDFIKDHMEKMVMRKIFLFL